MPELLSYEELRMNPPTPEAISLLPLMQRNEIIALSKETLDSIFKGFLTGDRLHKFYDEKLWIPTPELIDASLFAGQGNFDGLRDYTYDRIKNLSVNLKNPDTGVIDSFPVPSKNILKTLGIVERINEGKHRRTGEPVIAHIYRSFLRTEAMIAFYNDLYNRYGSHTRFTPDLAEIVSIVSNTHDFEEDKSVINNQIQYGVVKTIPTADNNVEKMLFLRRSTINRRGKTTQIEDIKLDLEPRYIPFLQNALTALNSTDVDQDKIVDRIMHMVEEQYAHISTNESQDIFPDYVLSGLPLYVKTIADRPDNLATYFTMRTKTNTQDPVPVEKIVTKSQENLTMFDAAELYLMVDNPQLFSELSNFKIDSEAFYSPGTLPFSNRRWAVLSLLGLSPNQMYSVPAEGGLPTLI